MKKILMTFVCVIFATFSLFPLNTVAGTKKNDPDKKEVLNELKELAGEHYLERMKVNSLCSLDFEDASGEDDYYHIYNASLKEGGYRIIIYDNTPKYLGFYSSDYEAVDYEEGAILLDSGESDEDGNSSYFNLPIPDKGPADKVRIDGVPTAFVKGPGADEKKDAGIGKKAAVGDVAEEEDNSPQYRDWKITMRGKEITVNAVFEKLDKGKVFIKSSKNGKVAEIQGNALSNEDKAYVKEIMAQQKK